MTGSQQGTVPEVPASGFLAPALFLPDLRARGRQEALIELVDAAAATGAIQQPAEVLRILANREILGSTAVGKGVAIPHGRSLAVPRPLLVVARSLDGVDWAEPDGEAVHLVFLLLSPDTPRSHKPYLEFLAHLARVAGLARNRKRLMLARDLAAVHTILAG